VRNAESVHVYAVVMTSQFVSYIAGLFAAGGSAIARL
jgi:hypothetical protein